MHKVAAVTATTLCLRMFSVVDVFSVIIDIIAVTTDRALHPILVGSDMGYFHDVVALVANPGTDVNSHIAFLQVLSNSPDAERRSVVFFYQLHGTFVAKIIPLEVILIGSECKFAIYLFGGFASVEHIATFLTLT